MPVDRSPVTKDSQEALTLRASSVRDKLGLGKQVQNSQAPVSSSPGMKTGLGKEGGFWKTHRPQEVPPSVNQAGKEAKVST